MIRKEEVFKIGQISRTHGVKGELEVQFTDDAFDRGNAEYLVLEIDGIFVPFFFDDYRYKGGQSALFTFEDYDTEEKAKRLVGLSVYYPFSALEDEDVEFDDLHSLKAFTGFRVYAIDEEQSSEEEMATYDLGEITNVDDTSMNILLTIVDDEGEERLIPFHQDFLVEVDMKERALILNLPLELITLND